MVFCPNSYLSCNEGWRRADWKVLQINFTIHPASSKLPKRCNFSLERFVRVFTGVLLFPLSLNLTVFPFLENISNCPERNTQAEGGENIGTFSKNCLIKTSYRELHILRLYHETVMAVLITNNVRLLTVLQVVTNNTHLGLNCSSAYNTKQNIHKILPVSINAVIKFLSFSSNFFATQSTLVQIFKKFYYLQFLALTK